MDHRNLSILITAGLLAGGVAALATSGESQDRRRMEFEVRQPFPAVLLPDVADGRPRSIAEFRGRKIVLHIFASW